MNTIKVVKVTSNNLVVEVEERIGDSYNNSEIASKYSHDGSGYGIYEYNDCGITKYQIFDPFARIAIDKYGRRMTNLSIVNAIKMKNEILNNYKEGEL